MTVGQGRAEQEPGRGSGGGGAGPQGAARGRSARTAWTGAVALAVTGGVLVSASASVPTPGTVLPGIAAPPAASTGSADHAPAGSSPARAVAVRDATTHDDVSVDQVLAVLDRAERALRQGPGASPDIAQAAAELGMLYTTYHAQELARPEAGDAPHAKGGDLDRVTFDDVAVAAMRLANMLDPTSPTALIEMRADAGSTLRRSLLRTVAVHGGSTVGYANGRIPADVLCPLGFAPGHMLRCDAAERLTALSAEFEKRFGYPVPLTDSYRSFASQVAVKGTKPHLAAIPGTSNHGWGLAIDLDDPIADGASAEYVWLRLHAPDYGWDNPSWARLGGAKPEPWHFEFFAAGSIPNRAIDPSDVGTWSPGDADARTFVTTATPPKDRPGNDAAADAGKEHGTSAPAVPENGTSMPPAGTSPKSPAQPGPSEPAPAKPAPSKPAPSKPAPSEPTPAEPPAQEEPTPGEPDSPADPGLVEEVVGGTVGLVDGVVGGVVGGLLGADGAASTPGK